MNLNFRCPMNWLKKLNNPFLLVVEGFVAGAILFAATNPGVIELRPPAATGERQDGIGR